MGEREGMRGGEEIFECKNKFKKEEARANGPSSDLNNIVSV